jgi:hypothetical protein
MTGPLRVITSLCMTGLTERARGDEVLAADHMGLSCDMTHVLTPRSIFRTLSSR